MNKPTVYAVMQATIEIPVQPSSVFETLDQMMIAAKREAADILRRKLAPDFCVVGQPEFLRAVIKDNP